MNNRVTEIILVGENKRIALLGYEESTHPLFPSCAQMQIYDSGDEPFEDCSEAYVDFFREEQVDKLIEALKKVKESFRTQ